MQTFRALGAPPPNPRWPPAAGAPPQDPTLRHLGPRLQTPVGLWRLGALPPKPQDSPLHYEFLTTRLGVHLSAGLHLNSGKKSAPILVKTFFLVFT